MRTNLSLPVAIQRSLPLIIGSVFVFTTATQLRAEGPPSIPAASADPLYASYGFGQENYPSAQNVSLSSPAQIGAYSITPETLGDLLMIHRQYLAAIEAYQRAPRDSAVVWNKLGIAYQHMYALDIAKLQYEKSLSINPKYPEALNNLGTVYYGQQNYHKAEKYYHKAIHLKPHDASFYSNLGTAYFADHDYKRGIAAYRKAFSIDPEVFIGNSLQRVTEMGPTDEQVKLDYSLAELYAQNSMFGPAIYYLRLAFIAGFKDNKKLLEDTSFAKLRLTTQFHLLLTEEHVKNPNAEESMVVRSKSPM
jgi:tetratricopeptide (TPR) repeat protein